MYVQKDKKTCKVIVNMFIYVCMYLYILCIYIQKDRKCAFLVIIPHDN